MVKRASDHLGAWVPPKMVMRLLVIIPPTHRGGSRGTDDSARHTLPLISVYLPLVRKFQLFMELSYNLGV